MGMLLFAGKSIHLIHKRKKHVVNVVSFWKINIFPSLVATFIFGSFFAIQVLASTKLKLKFLQRFSFLILNSHSQLQAHCAISKLTIRLLIEPCNWSFTTSIQYVAVHVQLLLLSSDSVYRSFCVSFSCF